VLKLYLINYEVFMAWRMNQVEEKRKEFVDACKAGVRTMTDLCREFDISRPNGYKWLRRYEEEGRDGLKDRSRAPKQQICQTDPIIEDEIIAVKYCFNKMGPKKIFAWLKKNRPETNWPCKTTIQNILRRHGLTISRKLKRRVPGKTSHLAPCPGANDVWCVDFKGRITTLDGSKCEPFTLMDAASRYLIRCVRLNRNDTSHVWAVLSTAFREFGLPLYLRHDNGPPFATCGVGRLSQLSVMLIKAGVIPEWIDPGKPQQNGKHERMHQTLKLETANPPEFSLEMQDRRFEEFVEYYNYERPHEAINQCTPGSIYVPSKRQWDGILRSPEYGPEYIVRRVRISGSIKWKGTEVYIGTTLTHEPVGLKEISDGNFEVHYGPVLLGIMNRHKEFITPPGNVRKRYGRCKKGEVLI
jgi:transposase InsO family protein